jgi:dolichol-phosphate mannosyltransferase
MKNPTLAVIIPVYNEADAIARNAAVIAETLDAADIDHTLVLVDDGSQDGSWDALRRLCDARPRVRALRFSRNFGKEAAITAGLRAITADRYLVMDSDLQHPPRYIPEMMRVMDDTGADVVDGVKTSRGRESVFYKLCAAAYYGGLRRATGMDLRGSSDFKLLTRPVVEALSRMGEGRIFFRGLSSWVGFRRVAFPFEVESRAGAPSSFSLRRRARFAVDSTLAFTSKPLYITAVAAVGFFIGAVILAVQTLYNYFSGRAVSGFTTVILLLLIIG